MKIDSAELDLLPEIDDLVHEMRGYASQLNSCDFSKSQRELIDGKSGSSALFDEAMRRLQSEGLIDVYLSPTDNAVRILRSILTRQMEEIVEASVLYALHVLESDQSQASVPIGLRMDKLPVDPADSELDPVADQEAADTIAAAAMAAAPERLPSDAGSASSSEQEGVVFDWLLSSYTPIKTSALQRTRTFKSVVQGLKFTFGVRDAYRRGHSSPTIPHHFNLGPEQAEEQVASALEGVDEWAWDVSRLREASGGRPLQALGWHVLHHWGLVERLGLDAGAVRKWLAFVESLYVETPYHSATHAANVLQAVHHALLRGGAARLLCTTRLFALLVAAIIHDAGHDGCNNSFHQVRRAARPCAATCTQAARPAGRACSSRRTRTSPS